MPSEDSFLAGKVGAHMTKGIQGDGLSDKYVLLLGALKHVTAYSLESWHDDSGGPRNGTKYNRMGFGFNLTRHDLLCLQPRPLSCQQPNKPQHLTSQ